MCKECGCSGHHHEHHHGHHHGHHHADEVFTSWGKETAKVFTEEEIRRALSGFADSERYAVECILRSIVEAERDIAQFDTLFERELFGRSSRRRIGTALCRIL